MIQENKINKILTELAKQFGHEPDKYYSAAQKICRCSDGTKEESCPAMGNI